MLVSENIVYYNVIPRTTYISGPIHYNIIDT